MFHFIEQIRNLHMNLQLRKLLVLKPCLYLHGEFMSLNYFFDFLFDSLRAGSNFLFLFL